MVADEFDRLWEAQKPHHPAVLTDEAHGYLRDTLLFQRKLLPVTPGQCLFEEGEFRARLSSPLQQNFRLLQELNNLRLISERETRALTLDERNILFEHLRRNMKATFPSLRALIGIKRTASTRFNLEQENRRELKGDVVGAQFSKPECIGEDWFSWPVEKKERLAELIATADDYDVLRNHLMAPPWSFSDTKAEALSHCNAPDDFGALSLKALSKIVPELQKEVVTYDVAVRRAGYNHHSALHTGEIFDQLPYYGKLLRNYTSPANKAANDAERQYGKISNPTVHIGLNQLRQLINALARRYGPPHQIVVELTREFGMGADKRREWIAVQNENRERNRRYDSELERLGQPVTRENRQRLQLWNELGQDDALNRVCIYTGKGLSIETLFSDEVEIDHILPFSRSLHDGVGNKILCVRQANREKGNRTPYEAFGHSPFGYDWNAILNRAATLPSRKASFFQEDALQKFLGENSFLDRHLNDTAYLSRVARQYLSYICHKDNVWISTGKLTAMLRNKFRLNELLSRDGGKNRDDHRHHALDAAVIGLCSRSLIQRISTAAERAERAGEQRLLEGLQLPWPGYREDIESQLTKVIPSHKPDRSRHAALHNDTNYGMRAVAAKGVVHTVTRRKLLTDIKSTELDGIADMVLRERIRTIFERTPSAKELKSALEKFSVETGVRRVRVNENLAVIPINDRRTHQPYRYVKGDGNYCYEIFDAGNGRWDGEVISYYDANQKTYSESCRKSRGGKPLLLRIHKNDLIAIEEGGLRRILRVAKFTDGKIELVDAKDARTRESGLQYIRKSPNALRSLKARMVGVDILGYVNDPGPRISNP